ncbi:hypothetical protein OG216_45650 [Streptomycetaceae bacterium NBC_01309]
MRFRTASDTVRHPSADQGQSPHRRIPCIPRVRSRRAWLRPWRSALAVTRITNGNFRLATRLVDQIERILEINQITTVTKGSRRSRPGEPRHRHHVTRTRRSAVAPDRADGASLSMSRNNTTGPQPTRFCVRTRRPRRWYGR